MRESGVTMTVPIFRIWIELPGRERFGFVRPAVTDYGTPISAEEILHSEILEYYVKQALNCLREKAGVDPEFKSGA
jgi:hypothetical protein